MIHQEVKLIIRLLYSRAAYNNNAGKKLIYHVHTNIKIFIMFYQLGLQNNPKIPIEKKLNG